MVKIFENASAKKGLLKLGKILGVENETGEYFMPENARDALLASKINENKYRNNPISENELVNQMVTGDNTQSSSLFLDLDPAFKYDNSLLHVNNMKLLAAPSFLSKEGLMRFKAEISPILGGGEEVEEDLFDELYIDHLMTYPSEQVKKFGMSTTSDILVIQEFLPRAINRAAEIHNYQTNYPQQKVFISDMSTDEELENFDQAMKLNQFLGLEQEEINYKTIYGVSALADQAYKQLLFRKGETIAVVSNLIGERLDQISSDPSINSDQARAILEEELVRALDKNIYSTQGIREAIAKKRNLDLEVAKYGVPSVTNIGTTYLRQAWDQYKMKTFVLTAPTQRQGLDMLTSIFMKYLDIDLMLAEFLKTERSRRLRQTKGVDLNQKSKAYRYSDFNVDAERVAHEEILEYMSPTELQILDAFFEAEQSKSSSETKTKQVRLTIDTFKPILVKITRNIIKDIVQKQHSEKIGLSPIQTGERFFKFKTLQGFKDVNDQFGVAPNMETVLYSTMEKQLRVLIHKQKFEAKYITEKGREIDLSVHSMFESAVALIGENLADEYTELKKSSQQTALNAIASLVRSQMDAFLSPLPAKPFKGHNSFLGKASELFLATALAKLGVMSTVSDALMVAFMGQGVLGQSRVKLLLGYMKGLLTEMSPAELKMLGNISEGMRTPIWTHPLGADTTLLNRITAIEHITERGLTYAKQLLMKNIGYELINGDGAVFANLIKRKILNRNDIDYLRKHKDYLVGGLDGEPILIFTRLNRNAMENSIHGKVISYITDLIPVHALTSTALAKSAHFMRNPLGFLIQAQFLFKGIIFDHSKSLFFDPLIMGDREGSVWGKYLFDAFAVSLMYHLIKHLLQGQVPDTREGKVGKATREIIMTAILDSPMFGAVGSTLKDLIDGGYKNPVSAMIPSHYGAMAKVPLGLTPALVGDFGKSANREISALNAFNPIHSSPAIGILFDRLITDGLRDLVYKDSKKYYQAINTIASNDGYRYLAFAKPDAVWGDKK